MMGQQFVMIDAETVARIERQLQHLTAALESATVIPAPEWCSIKDAARKRGVSTATIRRKVAMGQIEARGTGKTRQVRLV